MTDDNAAALQAVLEVIQASPEFQQMQDFGVLTGDMPGDYDSFLTSPMEESPYEDMLPTPALGSGDFDYLTSPAIVDADDFGAFAPDAPLFGNARYPAAIVEPVKAVPPPVPSVQHPVDFDVDGDLYTMSPETPALDPTSLQTSPLATPYTPSLDTPASGPRRKNAPTGTRKNITPEALVPFDAPIQSRKYVTPSATSRKAVPAGFAKKRARSQAFDEEDDASLDPNDLDAIEAKRRQNTLAARRSRKRKLEYQRELESNLDRLQDEKEQWKQRAQMLEEVMRSHGIDVPSAPAF
ncbi:bZIP transcription factor [Phanerochaete sordida]|uniref:BZIP transcription factor n=1 Tax=Phanerochaete sordida TaxID=48140 RepID=A0A9P3GBF6_9APHY|nr:bZIP transcription factor [Phanerochaete sordida]